MKQTNPSPGLGSTGVIQTRGLLAAATIGVLCVSCSGDGRGKGRGPEAVPVKVEMAVKRAMPVELHAVGTVEAYSTVAVTARAGGTINQIHFKEGEEVAAGDLLVSLDARPYRAALAEAEARLAGSRALARKAEEDLRRYTSLADKEYASKEQLDGVKANVEALRATVRGNEAAVENARLNLEYCSIRAPISGRTGSLLIHAGNVVSPSPQQPLVVIVQTRPIRVAFAVSEKHLDSIRARHTAGALVVKVQPADGQVAATVGKLDFLDNTVDHATGTIRLKAVFDNAAQALWPGQFVQVTLELSEEEDALVVPGPAVQTGQQGTYVFVVKDDLSAELRPVVVDRIVGSETVLSSGLEAGQSVVTDGHLRLVPGGKVTVRQGVPAGGEPPAAPGPSATEGASRP
jgi:membrane fusion protein, multidrug efflux system